MTWPFKDVQYNSIFFFKKSALQFYSSQHNEFADILHSFMWNMLVTWPDGFLCVLKFVSSHEVRCPQFALGSSVLFEPKIYSSFGNLFLLVISPQNSQVSVQDCMSRWNCTRFHYWSLLAPVRLIFQ